MKKIFLLLTAAILLSSAGCRSSNTQTVTSQISSEHGSSVSSVQKYESSTDTGPTEKTPQSTEKADETSSHGGNTVSEDETQDGVEKTKSESASVPQKDNISLNTPKEPVSSTESDGKESSVSSYNEADSNDETWIEKRVIELFNEYRNTPLKSLSGLSEYDKLRSVQLVTNFAHDTDDERKAATELKYGKYNKYEESKYDFETGKVIYTGRILEYYEVPAMEAIGRGGILKRTPEQIALEIASGFRNSAGHWSYLGSDEYRYIGCGVTIKDGNWYCCVSVAETNIDENP